MKRALMESPHHFALLLLLISRKLLCSFWACDVHLRFGYLLFVCDSCALHLVLIIHRGWNDDDVAVVAVADADADVEEEVDASAVLNFPSDTL